ncbi:MAG: RsmE family RNA methyltransferase [Candidatus Krumholzibacteria bacterium]
MRGDHAHHFLYYSQELEKDSARIDITGDEHHHLHRVLRKRCGDTVYITNGRGIIVCGTVETVGDTTTEVRVIGTVEERTPEQAVTLALACLKKDAFDQAVRQCTELGITRCLPFAADLSHLTDYSDAYLERLRRVVLSAMKQSFRSILPSIERVAPFERLLREAREHAVIVAGDADGQPLKPLHERPGRLLIVVGPEAGLSGDEKRQLEKCGCEFVSVSAYRLRSETSAAALTAALLAPSCDGGGDPV